MFRYVLKDRRSVDDDGHQDAVDGVQKYDIPKEPSFSSGEDSFTADDDMLLTLLTLDGRTNVMVGKG